MVTLKQNEIHLLIRAENPAADYLEYLRSILTMVQALHSDTARPELEAREKAAIGDALEFVKLSLPEESQFFTVPKGFREEVEEAEELVLRRSLISRREVN